MPEIPCYRFVYLPLDKLDKCFICEQTTNLMLCSACGEEIYCSSVCQKEDWKRHKVTCGGPSQNVRLDLNSFYPFLALLADLKNNTPDVLTGEHPGLVHRIMNDPDTEPPFRFPDGSSAKVVVLGEELADKMDIGKHAWWPTAPSDATRLKLFRRIFRDRQSYTNLSAVVIALLARIYTTAIAKASQTLDGQPRKRIRLHYRGSPIADFGVAMGTVALPAGSEMVYRMPDGELRRFQVPQKHYWIYFQTLRGEEYTLDCSLFPYYLGFLVYNDFYGKEGDTLFTDICPVAGFFRGKEMKNCPIRYETSRRFTALRNPALAEAIRHSEQGLRAEDAKAIQDWTSMIGGAPLQDREANLILQYVVQDIKLFDTLLHRETWSKWPKDPEIDFHNLDEHPDMKVFRHMTKASGKKKNFKEFLVKWNRRYKRGIITYEEWAAGCQCWRAKEADVMKDNDEDEDRDF